MMNDDDIIHLMRTIVDIPEDRVKALAKICKRLSISRAEAVRQAIDSYIASCRSDPSDEAFGIWQKKNVDGVRYQQKLRREWGR